MKILLKDIATARSGDKGDIANIGLMAGNPEAYAIIKKYVTAEKVKEHFTGIAKGEVFRYDLDNLQALEFVLKNALGGGATATIGMDGLGKSMSSALLRMTIDVDQ